MTKKASLSFTEQESIYADQLKNAKQKLEKLRNKRALEIGQLALKAGVADVANDKIFKALEKLVG